MRKVISKVLFVGLLFSNQAIAQEQDIPPSVQPGALEQQLRPTQPPLNRNDIVLPTPGVSSLHDGVEDVNFVLQSLTLEGNNTFSTADLSQYYQDLLGSEIALSKVFAVAERISTHYSDAGFALVVAYVPAQEIVDGSVKVSVVEGYVAEVKLAGDGGEPKGIIAERANILMADNPLKTEVLERQLLLLNDMPGTSIRSTLDRSDIGAGGTSLIFDVEHDPVEVRVGYNNRGTKALGPSRMDASIAFNDFVGAGSQLTLNTVRTVSNSDLEHYGMQLRTLLSSSGLELLGNMSWTDSEPGLSELRALEFASDGLAMGLGLRYPLLRSRSTNILLSGGLRMQNSSSDFLSVANSNDKTRAFDATASYDHLSDGGTFTSVSVTLSQGLGVLGATDNASPLKSRFDADFGFRNMSAEIFFITPLTKGFNMQMRARAQNAFDPLPAAEQCGYGGASFGRGFDGFELAGDSCFLASVELQKTWRQGFGGDDDYLQFYGFIDVGAIKLKGIVEAPLEHTSSATSLGLGFRMHVFKHLNLELEYAKPMDRDVRIEGNRKSRLFLNLSASF